MGEYIPASIQFGGKLPAAQVNKLIELLNDQNMHVNSLEQEEPNPDNLGAEFFDTEINYGNLNELRNFAHEHGLAYLHWFDSGPEWSAQAIKRDLTGRMNWALTDSDLQYYLSEEQIRAGDPLELLDWLKAPLPPLEIVS